jgi:hypothetical protein
MLGILLAVALVAPPNQYNSDEQVLARGQIWSTAADQESCLTTGSGIGSGSGVALSRQFAAPARWGLDLTGSIARRHAGRSGIPVVLRLLDAQGRETSRAGLSMTATPDGADLYADVPGDLAGRMRGAARAEFTNGGDILAISLADLPAALDELDRCVAAHSTGGE